MDVMGDKATLFETGRFVQPSGTEAAPEGTPYETEYETAEETAEETPGMGSAGETPDMGRDESRDETGGDVEEVRRRLAAESGDVEAMSVLGALLLRRGDLDGAEPHLRAATTEGDRAAANNLGVLLHQRGYPDEAMRLVEGRRRRRFRARGSRAGPAPP